MASQKSKIMIPHITDKKIEVLGDKFTGSKVSETKRDQIAC